MSQLQSIEILLVEDNPNDVILTTRALKKNNLVNRIHVVEDGEEALDFLFSRGKFSGRQGQQDPRVVLLDLKLPKLHGLEVLREIKSTPETQSIPVVVLTSSREDPDIQTAYRLGANSYVVKPVEFEAFQQVMTQVGCYWLLVNQTLK
jgi:two-component system, response regulator